MTRLSRNFTEQEFQCSCCGQAEVESNLVYQLQKLRDSFGLPLHINSGYRCEAHNKAVGGAKSSQHVQGKAADIRITHLPANEKYRLLQLILRLGTFNGVGVHRDFIHVDVRTSDKPVMWVY